MYRYGLIGNCQTSALVSDTGSIDWLCLPRPDSEPVFGRMLDPEGGAFSISGPEGSTTSQAYKANTTILVTTVTTADGSAFRITDFCPRFDQHGRMYRPIALFRKVEPLMGQPQVRVSCKPIHGWDRSAPKEVRGNSHLRYEIRGEELRLSTTMPLTYLVDETYFSIKEPLYFGLTWSLGIEEDLAEITERFLQQTQRYWETWVKHCSIPSLYQSETIRSALTLKLHCYEDTGAILAALTTSLPEAPSQSRNWDYRYCWLRDAYFALTAFHNLGHFEEMEGFLTFILNIVEHHDLSSERLRPVYRLDRTLPLPEIEQLSWRGHADSRPVRSGNQAADHVQNDVYGELILALGPIFFDERFRHLRTGENERLLEKLGALCFESLSKPDAGLWEIRHGWQEHTFSNLMSWAGLDRLARMKERGYLKGLDLDLNGAIEKAVRAVKGASREGTLRNGPKDQSFDSALLLMASLRFPDEGLSARTIEQIQKELALGLDSGFLYRYRRPDDFGVPESAFVICSFWMVQALARVGSLETARAVMERAMRSANPIGLFSEHFLPSVGLQGGNFPQAYSHVGQINAAFAISPPWSEVL